VLPATHLDDHIHHVTQSPLLSQQERIPLHPSTGRIAQTTTSGRWTPLARCGSFGR
jgi:hypothetical protein